MTVHEPLTALLLECAIAMEENCVFEGKLTEFIVLARRCRAAVGQHPASPPEDARSFAFDRYVDGKRMAEGVIVNRAETFEEACIDAARLASPGSVLVARAAPPPRDE